MIKKEIYPKTERLSLKNVVYITEKLDGENLTIFKKDNKIYVATRGCIINVTDDIETDKIFLYKGMYLWLKEHLDWITNNLYPNSAICGEWLGNGILKYSKEMTEARFYMFAKAVVDEDISLQKIKYNHSLFRFPLTNINPEQELPDFIKVVPEVTVLQNIPTIDELNKLYEEYSNKVQRNVEGFVINFQDKICKYVRMKRGKLTEHFEWGN